MDTTEFDEIRPYNDEELPQIFEELIADPAFQKAATDAIPNVPFELVRASWIFRKHSVMVFYGK